MDDIDKILDEHEPQLDGLLRDAAHRDELIEAGVEAMRAERSKLRKGEKLATSSAKLLRAAMRGMLAYSTGGAA